MKTLILILGAAFAGGALCGCTTAGNKPAQSASTGQTATDGTSTENKTEKTTTKESDDEYVLYYPTGSWVPIKVKKSAVKPSEQETRNAQEGLSELQRKGVKQVKENVKPYVPGT